MLRLPGRVCRQGGSEEDVRGGTAAMPRQGKPIWSPSVTGPVPIRALVSPRGIHLGLGPVPWSWALWARCYLLAAPGMDWGWRRRLPFWPPGHGRGAPRQGTRTELGKGCSQSPGNARGKRQEQRPGRWIAGGLPLSRCQFPHQSVTTCQGKAWVTHGERLQRGKPGPGPHLLDVAPGLWAALVPGKRQRVLSPQRPLTVQDGRLPQASHPWLDKAAGEADRGWTDPAAPRGHVSTRGAWPRGLGFVRTPLFLPLFHLPRFQRTEIPAADLPPLAGGPGESFPRADVDIASVCSRWSACSALLLARAGRKLVLGVDRRLQDVAGCWMIVASALPVFAYGWIRRIQQGETSPVLYVSGQGSPRLLSPSPSPRTAPCLSFPTCSMGRTTGVCPFGAGKSRGRAWDVAGRGDGGARPEAGLEGYKSNQKAAGR